MAKAKNRKKWIFSAVAIIILVAVTFLALPSKKNPSQAKNNSQTANNLSTVNSEAFNKNQRTLDEASSLWVVVNKGRALPSSYVPANLVVPNVPLRLGADSLEMHVRADTAAAMEQMFAAAKQDGINLMLASGYRSYANQTATYANYAQTYGVAKADTFSARPGHSEHQTGLAADIEPLSKTCELDQCFENTPEGHWLADNSYKYGFIIRYQKNTQNLTGYEYEPWHVRYLGTALAGQIHSSGQTLEQFFGLPVYTSYPSTSYEIKDI